MFVVEQVSGARWGVNVYGLIDKPQLRSACSEGLAILNPLHATIRNRKFALNHYNNDDSYTLALVEPTFASLGTTWCIINAGAGKIYN